MFFQNKKIVFFFVLLIFCAHSCLSPFEPEGSCTKCLPTQNLQNGSCYLKIRGCLTQKALKCAQCQVGYILSQNQCIRQAQYFNLTTLMPPPQKIEESKISQSQITPVMVGGFKETNNFNSPSYVQAKAILYKQYPTLSGLKIYKVQEQIVNGINYIFYIMNVENNDLYLAKVYVTFQLEASVQQIYKNNVSIKKGVVILTQVSAPVPGGWQQFINFSDQRYTQSLALIKSTFSEIDAYKLSRVEYQIVAGILFVFFYNSDTKNNVFIVEVYKPFYGQSVIQNTWGQKPNDVRLVSSGSTFQPSPVTGGSQTLPSLEYNSEPFLTAKSAILKVFPTFDVSLVKSISQQVVAGWNVFVSFTLPGSPDIYDVTVFIPLPYTGQQLSLSSIKKNGVNYNPSSQQKLSNSMIPPQSSTNQQTVSPLVGGFVDTTDFNSNLFIQAKKTLLLKYPQFQGYKITKVQQQLVNGINYIFYITDIKTGDKYVAKVYTNFQLQANIDNVTKNDVDFKNQAIVEQQQKQVTNTNQGVSSNNPVAGGFELVSQSDYSSEPFLTVKSTILKTFPQFTVSLIKKVQRQLVAGWNYFVIFTVPNSSDQYEVTIYIPLAFTGDSPQITSIKKNNLLQDISSFSMIQQTPSASLGSMTGGYLTTTDFTSQFYIKAKSTLFTEYPLLQSLTVLKVQQQVVSGKNYLFTIVNQTNFDTYVARVYVTLSLQASVEQITKNNLSIKKTSQQSSNTQAQSQTLSLISSSQQNQVPLLSSNTGSNQDLLPSEYNSKEFISIFNAIKKVIPNFDTKLITKVTKQIVAGWNYFVIFSFPSSNDSYQVKVYQPLPYTGLNPSVQSVKKNGIAYDLMSFSKVSNQIYSWQNDTNFRQLYKFFKKQININNLLPILQVTRQKKQNSAANWVEYKITFSKEQYAVCRYYQDYQIFEVISYVISGTQMYSVSGRVGYGIYDRTQNVLIDKIKSNDAKKLGRILVKEISVIKLSDFYCIYKLNGYTFEGHYELIFLDKGDLTLIQTNKLDSSTCYAIDFTRQVQYRQQYIIDQIRIFLFAKYNLTGFQITLAVGNSFNSTTNQYLILLTRSDLKKVRILVDQSNDKFVIRKIDVLNDGLALISDNLFQKSIEEMARKEYQNDLNGFQKVIITSNGTLNVIKFASDSALIKYTKLSSSTISKQSFSKSNSCFSIKSFTLDTCQKCNQNDFLWRGKCYTKIPNCLVQVGSICAACDKVSIESNGKCIKDCSEVFSL